MYLHFIPAYVYKITLILTGEFYFGYRTKNIKEKRLPEDDLWIHYFSSSNIIKDLIKIHGKDAFITEILKKTDPLTAYICEQKHIKENWNNPLLLNKKYQDLDNGKQAFRATSESAIKGRDTCRRLGIYAIAQQKIKETQIQNGTRNNWRLKSNTPEAKHKRIETAKKSGSMEKSIRGMNSKSAKLKQAASISKNWIITDPSGNIFEIKNLKKFCVEHNLTRQAMTAVSDGKQKHHKKWRCFRKS